MEPYSKSRAELTFDNRERWAKLTELFHSLESVKTSDEVVEALEGIYHTSGNKTKDLKGYERESYTSEKWPFSGLQVFLDEIASPDERDKFFSFLLPFLANLASKLEEFAPEDGLPFVLRQTESLIPLNRKFIASLLASGLLCSFPPCSEESATRTLNFAKFFSYFHRSEHKNAQAAKLRCFLHYFERISQSNLDLPGNVIFTRQVIPEVSLPSFKDWLKCNVSLCPVVVDHQGKIEEAGSDLLQVDFANCFIGGGVLGSGHTQEETRFSVCPELLVSMMFLEATEDNEVILIRGAERFSSYTGYGSTLKFAGDFRDTAQRDMFGNLETTVVAMDATSFKYLSREKQYERGLVLRELNKALVAFHCPEAGCHIIPGTTDDSEDNVKIDTAHEEPLNHDPTQITGLDDLGGSVLDRVFTEAWRDLEINLSKADDEGDTNGDLLTNIMKKSVEEVFKKTPEKIRLYTETVTNASLVPKCLQHQESSESTTPLVPGTPPSSRDHSGTQTPISPPGPESFVSGTLLNGTSFADTLSKSLLSCVSMTSSLANSIATAASASLEITSVTKESLHKSPRDLASPVKNGDKIISFLSQKVYNDQEANPLSARELHYDNLTEFTEDLSSVISMQKSDWSGLQDTVRGKSSRQDSPIGLETLDVCDFDEEAECEARRKSLEELALSLFEDFASSLAKSVLSSAMGTFGGVSQLASISEESEESSEDELEFQDDSEGHEHNGTKNGEFQWEETCESALEKEFASVSDEERPLRDEEREKPVSEHVQTGVTRDACSRGESRDSFHDSDSDSEPADTNWNSSDIEREIEDKFFELDLSDEEESSADLSASRQSLLHNFAAKLSVDVINDGISESISQRGSTSTETEEKVGPTAIQTVEQREVRSLRNQTEMDNSGIQHLAESYELSYEQMNNDKRSGEKNAHAQTRPVIVVTHHVEGMTSSLLSDALAEASQQLFVEDQNDGVVDLSCVENEKDSNNNEEEVGDSKEAVDDDKEEQKCSDSIESALSNEKDEGTSVDSSASQQQVDNTLIRASSTEVRNPQGASHISGARNIPESRVRSKARDGETSTSPAISPSALSSLQQFSDMMTRQLIDASTAIVDAGERLSQGTPTPVPVATGNWGCGVFKGDAEMKAVLQWMAASAVRCPTLVYHTFGDSRMAQLFKLQQTLRQRDWRVRDVMQVMSHYCDSVTKRMAGDDGGEVESISLFDMLLNSCV